MRLGTLFVMIGYASELYALSCGIPGPRAIVLCGQGLCHTRLLLEHRFVGNACESVPIVYEPPFESSQSKEKAEQLSLLAAEYLRNSPSPTHGLFEVKLPLSKMPDFIKSLDKVEKSDRGLYLESFVTHISATHDESLIEKMRNDWLWKARWAECGRFLLKWGLILLMIACSWSAIFSFPFLKRFGPYVRGIGRVAAFAILVLLAITLAPWGYDIWRATAALSLVVAILGSVGQGLFCVWKKWRS